MGRTATIAIRTPDAIILKRCRAYIKRKCYLQLVVFTKWPSEIDLLKTAYGGHSYQHGSGFIWVLSKRDEVVGMMKSVLTSLPSDTLFEATVFRLIPEIEDGAS